jgi:nucleoid DNA-binding protein
VITRQELIGRISKTTALPKGLVSEVLDALVDVADDEVASSMEFQVPGLFVIKSKTVPERETVDVNDRSRKVTLPRVETIYPKLAPSFILRFKDARRRR